MARTKTHPDTLKMMSLLLLRIASGLLMLLWGLDKLINPDHAMLVSNTFYRGLFSLGWLQYCFGAFQVLLGLLIVLGFQRKSTYPLLLLINTASLLAVWKFVIDPLGFFYTPGTEFLRQGQKLFFPSLIIFASVWVLMAFRDQDRFNLDRPR